MRASVDAARVGRRHATEIAGLFINRFARRADFPNSRQSLPRNIFRFTRNPNHLYVRTRPASSQRGGSRSSRTLRAGCDGRFGAARRAASVRTAKTRGPDLPTLGSSPWTISRVTVATKPGHRGERGHRPSNHRAGNAGCSGVPVVTNACAYYHCARGYGCIQRPAFPAPSGSRGTRSMHHSGAKCAAGMRSHIPTAVMPRLDRASSIPEAPRLNSGVSGILDRPIKSGDDTA
jgi:hypothetical protein